MKRKLSQEKISLILPTYKQEKTILKDISRIRKILEELPFIYEIIVVVDGSLDRTLERVKRAKLKKVKCYSYEMNRGKGYAVRFGVSKSSGDIIGFLDSGMDIDPTGIQMLINHMVWYDADIIVGSKLHPVSKVKYPLSRKILSWGYRTFTHILFGFKIRDTQAGIKFFTKKSAKHIFSHTIVDSFAFDVEVFALAYRLGYRRIYEAPIKLDFKTMSSISTSNFWKIIMQMLIDTIAVFVRINLTDFYIKRKIVK